MKIAGIDPSIRSSGKVIMDLHDDSFDIVGIEFYGYNKVKKLACDVDNIHIGHLGTDYDKQSMMERMRRSFIQLDRGMEDVKYVAFEDYAYSKAKTSGSNSIFQIGEFCGGARYHFYMQGKGIITYGIPQIKKFATGDGNAEKVGMCESFREFYPNLYPKYFDSFEKQYESPHADLCDAFWMCEILRNHLKYDILGPDSLPEETRHLIESKGHGKDTRALIDYDMSIMKQK